ncbi:hypothetical protein EAD89_26580 [Micromonospora sp. BL4]|nr:hypothetical protein EAD89_26580 [Micromonospora sp. BL4]
MKDMAFRTLHAVVIAFASACVGLAGVLTYRDSKYASVVWLGMFVLLHIFLRALDRRWMSTFGRFLQVTGPTGVAAMAVKDAEEELAEIQERVEAEVAALHARVETESRVADDLQHKIERYQRILALTTDQVEIIGRFMADYQAKRARRDVWIGVGLGALFSIPIGIVINLVT